MIKICKEGVVIIVSNFPTLTMYVNVSFNITKQGSHGRGDAWLGIKGFMTSYRRRAEKIQTK